MARRPLLALCCALATLAVAQSSPCQEPPAVLDYFGRRAARMATELPEVPSSLDAWEQHREHLVSQLQLALGLPDRQPMKAAIIDTTAENDLVIEEVAYLWAGDTYVSATVIRDDKAAGRRPAIVITPGELGHYTYQAYREAVDALARDGCVVLFIDDPRIARRHAPHAGLHAAASAAGTQVAGIQVFDALRALDYLLTRTDVDPDKIGIAGLGQGALQAYMAAALEPGFRFVVAVGGTTTCEALIAANAAGHRTDGPSAFIAGLLRYTDMDRVAACLAPRPVLIAGSAASGNQPVGGYLRVLRTMRTVYGLYDAGDRIHKVAGEATDDMRPYIPEVIQWLRTEMDAAERANGEVSDEPRAAAAAAPDSPVAELDFNMLRHMQREIADRATSLPTGPESTADWQAYRQEAVPWLRAQCDLDSLRPAADEVIAVSDSDGLVTEQLALGVDEDFHCPALLVRPATVDATKCAAVVLSHDDRQCAASVKISEAARTLAASGLWVIIPEHASVHPQSLQRLANPQQPSFYGDEARRLYGTADAVGLPPLALRVAENLAAFRYLAARSEVDLERIVLVGDGVGGVDSTLAALLEDRVAGVASINATTMRDWCVSVAPGELHFFHVMPYLPSLLVKTDLDLLAAAVAPRPLLLVRLKDGWPRSGFEQVATTASAAYKLQKAEDALLVLGPRDVTEEFEAGLTDGVQRQLASVVRTLVPAPPQAGIVGNTEGLRPRRSVDSAAGLIWIVAEMDGYDQELTDEGFRLQSWSFFNDNGDAQSGRAITPLLLETVEDKYRLIGIGTSRVNAGTGVQTFPFDPVEGTDSISESCFFGWHTGDVHGKSNPGVVEYEDASDARMVILTSDGQMTGQKLQLGNTYRLQSQFPRRYSVMATSKR